MICTGSATAPHAFFRLRTFNIPGYDTRYSTYSSMPTSESPPPRVGIVLLLSSLALEPFSQKNANWGMFFMTFYHRKPGRRDPSSKQRWSTFSLSLFVIWESTYQHSEDVRLGLVPHRPSRSLPKAFRQGFRRRVWERYWYHLCVKMHNTYMLQKPAGTKK